MIPTQIPTADAVTTLCEVGRRFYARGWALGTSGNFSAVLSRDPFELAITASAVAKGDLRPSHILHCNDQGRSVCDTPGTPSAEALLHIAIARRRHADAVLHTHSVWSTLVSDAGAAAGGVAIEGYEMLKGLRWRADARTPRVDSDSRQRSGHDAPSRAASSRRSASIRRRTRFCCGATGSTRGARHSPTPNATSRSSSSSSRRSADRRR